MCKKGIRYRSSQLIKVTPAEWLKSYVGWKPAVLFALSLLIVISIELEFPCFVESCLPNWLVTFLYSKLTHDILLPICHSIIAAVIFYYIVTVRQLYTLRKISNPAILRYFIELKEIVGKTYDVIYPPYSFDDKPKTVKTKEQYIEEFKHLELLKPQMGGSAFERLKKYKAEINDLISNLASNQFLSIKERQLIEDIRNSFFMSSGIIPYEEYEGNVKEEGNQEGMGKSIYELKQLTNKLEL